MRMQLFDSIKVVTLNWFWSWKVLSFWKEDVDKKTMQIILKYKGMCSVKGTVSTIKWLWLENRWCGNQLAVDRGMKGKAGTSILASQVKLLSVKTAFHVHASSSPGDKSLFIGTSIVAELAKSILLYEHITFIFMNPCKQQMRQAKRFKNMFTLEVDEAVRKLKTRERTTRKKVFEQKARVAIYIVSSTYRGSTWEKSVKN